MESEVILLVTGALIALVSALLTSVVNYRLSKRHWQEEKQYEAQKELRKSLTYAPEDVRRQGLGPLRGSSDANQDTSILPSEVACLEVNMKSLVQALTSIGTPSIRIENLLHLALEIDKADSH